jgi:hypothetical protein
MRREGRNMETRFYQTQAIDLQRIAQALVYEYEAQGYEVQQAGTPEQVIIQLRKENTLRAITGFNKELSVILEKVQGGTLMRVGAHDWMDQIAVGAVGLVLHPLLITAAVGAVTQQNVVYDLLNSIDQQVRQQQPHAQWGIPPMNLEIG